jgi:hypothetical protein
MGSDTTSPDGWGPDGAGSGPDDVRGDLNRGATSALRADDTMARRLKALALTRPIHDLDARKHRLEGADYTVYAMAELALLAIDLVTVAMDFDRGADHLQVLRRLVPHVAAQAPGRPPAEHERVARWVLDNLINVGSVDRGFDAVYGTYRADGRYERRRFDFKLLVELASPGGEIYLRTTDEAVTVLVGALDTDVSSAQVATEVTLDNLIRRGRLSDARAAAEQARYRTVQYAEGLRRRLEATRRDVAAVDWLTDVPDLLDDALAHVEDRYRHENAILTNIRRHRDSADGADHKRRAAELVELVSDCVRRHTQLQARLLEAGAVFRAEQDRQQFADAPARAGVDLYAQLLAPTLACTVGAAQRPALAFFTGVAGVRVPRAPRLLDLVETLLSPSAERAALGAEVVEPELVEWVEPGRFSDEQWARAMDLLDVPPDPPRRLSGLLADARRDGEETARLVALVALHALAPEIGTARRQGDEALLVAVDDGTPLDDPTFAGSDLLVARVGIQPGPPPAGTRAGGSDARPDELRAAGGDACEPALAGSRQ